MENIDTLLKKVKRIHFIGIGGSGMCPLAEILHSWGYELSGSDNNESDTLARIRALGIPVAMGQRAENIGDAEMVVYTAALLPDNPELVRQAVCRPLSAPSCSVRFPECIKTASAFAARTAKPPSPRC